MCASDRTAGIAMARGPVALPFRRRWGFLLMPLCSVGEPPSGLLWYTQCIGAWRSHPTNFRIRRS